jgi:hypothetical protein
MLPPTLMVSAGYNRFVVFTCEHVDTTNVRLKTVIRPGAQFAGIIEGDGDIIRYENYINQRVGGDKTFYNMATTRLNRWLRVGSEKIYEYKLDKPCLSLPIEFYDVYMGKDTTENWHLLAKPKIPVAQPIPPHVLKGFVAGLIAAKETCPVTMEELTLGNIAVTGCYHAFERSTMDQIMSTTRICPTCRSPLTENILM